MSVVNGLLRDLESRGAKPELANSSLSAQLRVGDLDRVRSRWRVYAAIAAISGVFAGGVWWLQQPVAEPVGVEAVVEQPVVVEVAPAIPVLTQAVWQSGADSHLVVSWRGIPNPELLEQSARELKLALGEVRIESALPQSEDPRLKVAMVQSERGRLLTLQSQQPTEYRYYLEGEQLHIEARLPPVEPLVAVATKAPQRAESKPVPVAEPPPKRRATSEKPKPTVKTSAVPKVDALPKAEDEAPPKPTPPAVVRTAPQLSITAQAKQLVDAGRFDAALRLLEDAGDDTEALAYQTRLLISQRRYREAEAVLDRRSALATLELIALKGRLLIRRQAYAEAFQRLSAGLQESAGSEYRGLLATAAQRSGELTGAVRQYSWLTQREPEQARWWVGLGFTWELSGDKTQAQQAYQAALRSASLSRQLRQFVDQRLVALE